MKRESEVKGMSKTLSVILIVLILVVAVFVIGVFIQKKGGIVGYATATSKEIIPPPPNLCEGVVCNDYCDGTNYYYGGKCLQTTGACEFIPKLNAVECGYVEPPVEERGIVNEIYMNVDYNFAWMTFGKAPEMIPCVEDTFIFACEHDEDTLEDCKYSLKTESISFFSFGICDSSSKDIVIPEDIENEMSVLLEELTPENVDNYADIKYFVGDDGSEYYYTERFDDEVKQRLNIVGSKGTLKCDIELVISKDSVQLPENAQVIDSYGSANKVSYIILNNCKGRQICISSGCIFPK